MHSSPTPSTADGPGVRGAWAGWGAARVLGSCLPWATARGPLRATIRSSRQCPPLSPGVTGRSPCGFCSSLPWPGRWSGAWRTSSPPRGPWAPQHSRAGLPQAPSWPMGPRRGGRAARWGSRGLRQSRRCPPAPHRSPPLCYWAEKHHRQPVRPSGILATLASRSVLQLPPASASTPLSWAPCALPSAQNGFTRTRLGRSLPPQTLCPQEGTRLPGSWPTLRPPGPAPTATPVLDKLCPLPGTPSHWGLSAEGHLTAQDQLHVSSWAAHPDTSRQVNTWHLPPTVAPDQTWSCYSNPRGPKDHWLGPAASSN